MTREKVGDFRFGNETHKLMLGDGLYLVTKGKDRRVNAMTIGWGFIGTMWKRPFFIVAVRLSRHTYRLMEESDSFTVCLPSKGMTDALDFCGTESGRDHDKLQELGLTAKKSFLVAAPYIEECPVHYECKISFKTIVQQGALSEEIETGVYPNRNYHILYYGEILGVYAIKDAEQKLS
ncbi:MAG: flavin reductase family protein [Candidatus Bathyarchaeota archaeon]|jgi:flavin reductase (DIM6/NTAB) family NADH-FMN oxidoreductase RutF|nr:flavin reductase family protein [Candidatus Bathyarchaeota archaeon]